MTKRVLGCLFVLTAWAMALVLVSTSPAWGIGLSWSTATSQPSARGAFGVAATADTIFLVGGSTALAGGETSDLRIFTGSSYALKASIPEKRRNSAVAISTDSIWSVGGANGTLVETGVYVYHIPGNSWATNIPAYPIPIKIASAVILGDTLYVIAGDSTDPAGGEENRCYRINVKNPTAWAAIANYPLNVSAPSAAVVTSQANKIYVFGGYNGVSDQVAAYSYSVSTNAWTALTNIPRQFSFGASAVRGDTIYLIGGYGNGVDTNTVVAYNVNTNSYSTEATLPARAAEGAAAILNDTLYVWAGLVASSATSVDTLWISALPVNPPNSGTKWYVNDTSTVGDSFTTTVGIDTNAGTAAVPFRTIIKALNMALSGDTIYVDAGIFDSYMTVSATETAGIKIDTNNITIIGKDSASTIIDPPGPNTTIGLYGIYADTQTGLSIQNLAVTGAYYGLRFYNVDISTLSNDSVSSNGLYGMYLEFGSDTNTISKNIVSNNGNKGISLYKSYGNTVTGNTARANTLDGIELFISNGNTITSNASSSNSSNGLYLDDAQGNSISQNTFQSNAKFGIYFDVSLINTNNIRGNTIGSNVQGGIRVNNANNNIIQQNDISGGDTGIAISGTSTGNVISKNNILGNNLNFVSNTSGNAQTLTRNWFGTTDEVAISAKISDTANAFRPYRLSAVDTAAGADTTAPASPATFSVTFSAPAGGPLTISWTNPTTNEETNGGVVGFNGVTIYRLVNLVDTTNWGNFANEVHIGAPTETTWTDTNVVGGSTYYYRLTSHDSGAFENESFFNDTNSYTVPAASGGPKKWYVNDTSTAGDSFTTAIGIDTAQGDSPAAPFLTIMKALSVAKSKDTILIDRGIFSETVVIDTDNMYLIGMDSSATVIDPPGVNSTAGLYGIYSSNRKFLLIKNLGVTGAYDGIRFSNVDQSTISGDSVFSCGDVGIFLTAGSDSNTVSKNTLRAISTYSIQMDSGNSNTISGNYSTLNGYGILLFSGGNTVDNNTFDSNNNIGIYLSTGGNNNNITNNFCDTNGTYGIYVGPGNNNLISGNTVMANPTGIYLTASTNMTRNNVVKNNQQSGILIDADSQTVFQNDISGNDTGVRVNNAALTAIAVNKNNIQNNNVNNLHNTTGSALNFTRNWWGTADEASIRAKISDTLSAFLSYRLGVVDTGIGTDTTAPDKPGSVTLDTSVAGQIKVSWVIPALNEETNGGAVGFNGLNIWRLVNTPDTTYWSNPNIRVKSTISTETSWTDTNVTLGNTYYYRLTSKDAVPNFNESFFTDTKFVKLLNPAGVLQVLSLDLNQVPDIAPGETLLIRVFDTGANTNPGVAETFTLRIKNLATGEQETPTLTEDNVNTELFSARFRFSGNAAHNAGGSGKLYVLAGDTVQLDYTDPTNALDTTQKILKVVSVLDVRAKPVADTQIRQGETGAVLAFAIINENPNDDASPTDTLIQLQVTRVGGADTHVAVLKIWVDTGIPGTFEPNVDIFKDSALMAAGMATFNNLTGPGIVIYNPGDTRHFIVTVQVFDTVLVGDNVDFKIAVGGVSHALAGQVPDTDINSPGVLAVVSGKPKLFMSVGQDVILMPVGYNGPSGDTVPGATLTYVLRYDNDGGETSVNFVLNAKIPQNTQLAQADTALASPHTGATATVTITDDTGTVVPVSDPTASRIKWTFSVGVGSNNGDAFGVIDASAPDADAGFVKYKVYIK